MTVNMGKSLESQPTHFAVSVGKAVLGLLVGRLVGVVGLRRLSRQLVGGSEPSPNG